MLVKKKNKDYRNDRCLIIDTLEKLEAFVEKIEGQKVIGVDLEADSMYHFKEKVCLIQMSAKNLNVVIDPLQVHDLSILKPIFSSHDIIKIFHGSDYDIRSLHRDFGIKINGLFDTQLAGMFLGIEKTGLDALVKKYFNIDLDKKYQKKDWSQRPLPEEMIEYAANDVKYLIPLVEILKKKLEEKMRLMWVWEECEILSKVRCNPPFQSPLYLKIKGAGKLSPKHLAVLEAILQFRLKIAQQKDKPLYKIINNASMLNIARSCPESIRLLENTKILSKKQVSIYGEKIVTIIKQNLKIPEDSLPVYPKKHAPLLKPSILKKIKVLKVWRDSKSSQYNITAGILCNNALIKSIAIHNPANIENLYSINDIKKWQITEFGCEILNLLKPQGCNQPFGINKKLKS